MSRPKRVFTSEQQEAIVRRYATGEESISAIAETLNATRQMISHVLTGLGVKIRHHQHALTPSQEAEVVRRFEGGESALAMERLFGVDRKSIRGILDRREGPLRRCGKKRDFESHEDWRRDPRVRLRNLLLGARANERGHSFDNALIGIITENPPERCASCRMILDYNVYSRDNPLRSRSPSLDRCDNARGYVVGNVYVVCLRCNRLKNDASLEELRNILAYVEDHMKRRGVG